MSLEDETKKKNDDEKIEITKSLYYSQQTMHNQVRISSYFGQFLLNIILCLISLYGEKYL